MGGSKKIALHWQILIGLILGVVVGLIINAAWDPGTWSSLGVEDPAAWVAGGPAEGVNENANLVARTTRLIRDANGFIGDLFLRGLRFIAVPIVVFSLIVGASSLNDLSKLSRIGGKTIGIYIVTTAIAITVGLVFANVVKPGSTRFISTETRDSFVAQFGADADAKVLAAHLHQLPAGAVHVVRRDPEWCRTTQVACPARERFECALLGIADVTHDHCGGRDATVRVGTFRQERFD